MSRHRTPAVGAWSRGRARCVPVERARQGTEEAAGVRMAPRGERQQPSPDHEQSLSQAESQDAPAHPLRGLPGGGAPSTIKDEVHLTTIERRAEASNPPSE